MLANVRTPLAIIATSGYLIGSIPVANHIARRHGVADLRDVGDRNPGYWNARQLIGVREAAPIFVGDVVKGAVAAAVGATVASAAGGSWWWRSVGGGAAMVGHAFPAFDGCRGGRSVLAFVGTSVVAAPKPSVVALSVAGATWVTTRRFDLAARTGVGVFPLVQLVVEGPRRTAVSGALMTFVGLRFATAGRHASRAEERVGRATSANA